MVRQTHVRVLWVTGDPLCQVHNHDDIIFVLSGRDREVYLGSFGWLICHSYSSTLTLTINDAFKM